MVLCKMPRLGIQAVMVLLILAPSNQWYKCVGEHSALKQVTATNNFNGAVAEPGLLQRS
jgi:hypothetical protein